MVAPPLIRLTHEPIDHAALTDAVRSDQAGAVVLFLGTVREMTEGRRTLALDYEAYPEMALAKLRELHDEACHRWPIVKAALVHRLGRLELGDVSVAVAVSCPHRAQAFDAGRFLIDRLKETVPIWKKENWADGTTEWVDSMGQGAQARAREP
jgi:molybdopterin synthase catalytic subunit